MHINGVDSNFFVRKSCENDTNAVSSEPETAASESSGPEATPITLSLGEYVDAVCTCESADGNDLDNGEYTLDDLKNKYHLTDQDINIFFTKQNGKLVIRQNAVKSCFGREDIKTVEQLLDAMRDEGFSEGYIRGAYSLSSEIIEKYLILISDNPKKYILNQEAIQKDFPDKNIQTLGQLMKAINPSVRYDSDLTKVVGYSEGELRGRCGLTTAEIEMFFTKNETGGYILNQEAITDFYGEYNIDTLEKLSNFVNTFGLGQARMKQICEFYTEALRNGDSKYGFDKLVPKPTEEEFQEFYNQLIALDPNGKKSLRDLEILIIKNLPEIINSIQLQRFNNIIQSDELDKYATLDELNEYINNYSELIKAELKLKYNYPDEYIDKIISFAIEDLGLESDISDEYSFGGNIKDILTKLKNNIEKLMSKPDLHAMNSVLTLRGMTEIDIFEKNNINAYDLTIAINKMAESDNIQERFFAKLFKDKIDELGLNESEQVIFFRILLQKIGKLDDFGNYSINVEYLENLNKNGDSSWFDELFKIAMEEFSKVRHIEDDEINNATGLDISALFNGKNQLTAEDILNNYDTLKLSNDPGVRKFIQMIENAFNKFNIIDTSQKENFIKLIFILINRSINVNSRNTTLDKTALENLQLNEKDIFAIVEQAINDTQKYSMIDNDSYKGDLYYTINNNNVLIITNLYTKKTEIVDLNKLVENLPDDKKAEAIKVLHSLPAETLIDISHESSFYDGSTEGTGGVYKSKNDDIHINEYDIYTITHESGHAFDHTDDGFWSDSEPFASTFRTELEAYIASGGVQDQHDYVDGVYTDLDGVNGNYCTLNQHEMFAECYSLLMIGSPSSSNASLIKEHFPKCLELVRQHLNEVRNSSDSYRRN